MSHDDRHLTWAQLNDAADGRTPDAFAHAQGLHLASCGRCGATVASLRALRDGARRLPPALEPPATLWGDIAATIAAGGNDSLAPRVPRLDLVRDARADGTDVASTPAPPRVMPPRPPRRFTLAPATIAAAAVFLMALGSGLTALVLRPVGRAPTPTVASGDPPPREGVATGVAPGVLPAAFVATEAAYLATVADLQGVFVAQRSALSPATVAVVERSLRAIDTAIVEARTALLADPANQALAELLSTNYRQKVELLRRAAEHSAS